MSTIGLHSRPSPAWLRVIAGGLVVAIGDTIFASTLWFGWSVPGLVKLFQTIAVGVLGKASFEGGMGSAWLGAGLQVFMATMFVVVYTLASQRAPSLLRRPFVLGPVYGVLLYVVMNFVVMPLSRVDAHPTLKHPDWIVLSILAHMAFGVVCVLSARRALQR